MFLKIYHSISKKQPELPLFYLKKIKQIPFIEDRLKKILI